jgi:protein-disulfide isomerase
LGRGPSGSSQSENGGDSAQTGNGDPIAAGPDTAPVTIVEYGDYACPYCRGEEPTLHELRRRYGGQVRIVFRDFPLKIHPGAMEAAMAARCAEEQGAFQQYHDALYTGRYGFSRPQLEALAGSLGLDTAAFSACLDAEGSRRLVTREIAQAQRLGVHVTPTFLIDGQRLVGEQSISSFESVINAQLAAHR